MPVCQKGNKRPSLTGEKFLSEEANDTFTSDN